MADLRRRNGGGGGGGSHSSNRDKHDSLFPKPDTHIGDNAAAPPPPVSNVKSRLIEMGFSSSLVHKKIDENGIHKGVEMDEMIDCLVAAQLDEKYAEDSQDNGSDTNREENDVVLPTEVPSELPLDKTSQLLEMGFSRQEISTAIEKLGEEAQISDLAESILIGQVPADNLEDIEKKVSEIPSTARACPSKSWRFVAQEEKEGSSSGTATKVGKRIKDEESDDFDNRGKRLRPALETPGMQEDSATQPPLSQYKRPYVFYGNIGELSPKEWSKISSFFFGIQPEHVDTRLCSTLSRKESYMHNLPVENRFHILPKPTRSAPPPPPSFISSPENLERIMGYPPNHTNIGSGAGGGRLKPLDYCFQTDTLGYHLSVLKPMFPQGLRVLSLFSGIGGAEIALSRLGIHLRSVCSVEPCGLSRSVLKRWWGSSGQSGELEQIEDIRSLRTKRLEALVGRFGGFDLIICQNPPTPADLSRESSRSGACGFDFTLFNQVVRVSKLVRGLMESI
ncbi:hypothetical protein IGI04_038327 [Brassica rapa subsp. trilocularis]|uniref:SAM-dependent MTase DRM-type domain-containing protein n=1 Tax=Brassica rapa subsp. trilocularis TaxID=1813537 RepID=A0ABQ7LJY9_BRACM|nr:hypothetical protein IGI04_038327 [Brassica rapa subsp. trilocularis]